jgi:hypothetical protein
MCAFERRLRRLGLGVGLAAAAAAAGLQALPACATAEVVPASAVAPAPAVSLIQVPPALARRSETLEPSGVVWAAKLDRFLVVSDDTGSNHDHHQPWVLAMSRAGAFDEAPVPLVGLEALNDAESICAGPDGLLFLVTSHSLTKRGLDRKARDLLLLLGLEGRALRVLGRVDLTTASGVRDPGARADSAGNGHGDGSGNGDGDGRGALLALAGLPVDGALDIEAVTYRQGALLIGLKAPLTARDGAVVLRLAAPVEALRAGRVPPGALTRAYELALHGAARGIPEGIADLTSLPDGRLAVLGNSPKGRARDDGGSLYWFQPETGVVTFVHQWMGLHPEGVTLSETGKELVIVFDANRDPPRWTRWPLPASAAAPLPGGTRK